MINSNGIFGTNSTMPDQINLDGAVLQGTIKCTYDDLVHAFGEPIDSDVAFSWLVVFNDYSTAKVHGVKELLESVYWNIDGFSKTAFIRVSTTVQRSLKKTI
jgi:hypothetical protein